jgi:thymidine phosphorylase
MCLKKEGATVRVGEPLFELHADDEAHLEAGRHAIHGAITIGDGPYTVLGQKLGLIRD